VETLTLNFSKITWTYKKQKEGMGQEGNVENSWDQSTNTGEETTG